MNRIDRIKNLELMCISEAIAGRMPDIIMAEMFSETYRLLESRERPKPTGIYLGVIELPIPARKVFELLRVGSSFDVLAQDVPAMQSKLLNSMDLHNKKQNTNLICEISRSTDRLHVIRIQ